MRAPRRPLRHLLLVVAASAVLLAGCSGGSGSDGGSKAKATTTTAARSGEDAGKGDDEDEPVEPATSTEEEYVAAIEADLTNGSVEDGQLDLTEEQAACVAPRWVDAITVDALHASGVGADGMADFEVTDLDEDAERGQAMVDALSGCGLDVNVLVAQSFGAQGSEEAQACAEEEVDPDLAEAVLVAGFGAAPESEFQKAYDALLEQLDEACGSAEG